MTVTRADILVVLAAVGVVAFVALLPSPRDNNPAVPDSTAHRGLQSERDCLRCHAAGAAQALPARHPSRKDCFRCHRPAVTPETEIEGSKGGTWHVPTLARVEMRGKVYGQSIGARSNVAAARR